MKICILYFLTCFLILTVHSQKLKNKDIKLALEAGKLREISIITEDPFTPEQNQELDLKVTFQDGSTALASDFHTIWDQAVCTVTNAGVRAKSGLLSEGKGLIVPNVLPMYYPAVGITISIELAGKSVTKELRPNLCIENYTILQQGTNGVRGRSGSSGSDGDRGDTGSNGPDMEVKIEEETVSSKTFMVIIFADKKFMLDPECSSVKIISSGGRGGNGGKGGSGRSNRSENGENGGDGGDGGRGGKGGTITVSGSAVEKYKTKITLISVGGDGGSGGASGSGGSGGPGKSSGRSGSSGSSGLDGNAGSGCI
jgi:hypothetical protein